MQQPPPPPARAPSSVPRPSSSPRRSAGTSAARGCWRATMRAASSRCRAGLPKPHGVLSQLLGQNLSREARFLISSPSSEWFPMSLYGFLFQTKRGTFESQKKRDIWAEGAATPRLCMGRVAWRCSLPKSVGSLCLGTRAHNSALRSACGPLRC